MVTLPTNCFMPFGLNNHDDEMGEKNSFLERYHTNKRKEREAAGMDKRNFPAI